MSSYTSKTYIVFLDLPPKIAAEIDLVRSKYSDGFKKYPAHITLKQDEDFLIASDQIGQIVESQIKNQQALKVKIKRPEIMRNKIGWNIYLPVESGDLQELVKRISQALENFIDPNSPRAFLSTKWEQSGDFYGHISIKGGDVSTNPTYLLAKIQKENFGINFPCEIICKTITLANWQKDKWQKIESFKLNNKYVQKNQGRKWLYPALVLKATRFDSSTVRLGRCSKQRRLLNLCTWRRVFRRFSINGLFVLIVLFQEVTSYSRKNRVKTAKPGYFPLLDHIEWSSLILSSVSISHFVVTPLN